jgi:ribosomal protein S18 acetylase RimI-like enzyme
MIKDQPRVTSVRAMTAGDIDAVVNLQIAFLEGSLITELGSGFLRRFHQAALAHASIRAFVAVDSRDAILGFVQASADVHAFNSHVKPRVITSLGLALLAPARWRLIPHFAHAVSDREPQPAMPAELLLLVVDAAARRQQIGRRLVSALEDVFCGEQVSVYRVAVRSHLAVARAFYLATGFTAEQELTVLGAPMTYLTKEVRS